MRTISLLAALALGCGGAREPAPSSATSPTSPEAAPTETQTQTPPPVAEVAPQTCDAASRIREDGLEMVSSCPAPRAMLAQAAVVVRRSELVVTGVDGAVRRVPREGGAEAPLAEVLESLGAAPRDPGQQGIYLWVIPDTADGVEMSWEDLSCPLGVAAAAGFANPLLHDERGPGDRLLLPCHPYPRYAIAADGSFGPTEPTMATIPAGHGACQLSGGSECVQYHRAGEHERDCRDFDGTYAEACPREGATGACSHGRYTSFYYRDGYEGLCDGQWIAPE